MALDAVVYPQDPLGYGFRDFYCLGGGTNWGHDFGLQEEEQEEEKSIFGVNLESSSSLILQNFRDWDHNNPNSSSSPDHNHQGACRLDQSDIMFSPMERTAASSTGGRRKRRRTKSAKNKEEIENQRMTHIAVERNRRKQMNEYLSVLRSLMPPSYVQRGDQASIIGGAINFVKELEQQLQFIKSHNSTQQQVEVNSSFPSPFAEFFSFPQYSSCATQTTKSSSMSQIDNQWAAVGDIEVTMVDNHANLKILSKKLPRQLLKMVAGFHSLRLTVLHLNVTTMDHMILYSFSVKVEEGCQLSTVDEIAAGVNQMLHTIQDEAAFS